MGLFGSLLMAAGANTLKKEISIASYRAKEREIAKIEREYCSGTNSTRAWAWIPGYVECRLRTNYVRANYGDLLLGITDAVKQRIEMSSKHPDYQLTRSDSIINSLIGMKNERLPEGQKIDTITSDDVDGPDVLKAIKIWRDNNPRYSIGYYDCNTP